MNQQPSQLASAFRYDSPKIEAQQVFFAYAAVDILSCMQLDACWTHDHRSVPCNRGNNDVYHSPASWYSFNVLWDCEACQQWVVLTNQWWCQIQSEVGLLKWRHVEHSFKEDIYKLSFPTTFHITSHPSFPLFCARMPNSSRQVHPQVENQTPSPEISLSTRTSPSKLVKVSFPWLLMHQIFIMWLQHHRFLGSLSLTRTQLRLRYENCAKSLQILRTRKKMITVKKPHHQSEVKQMMLIRMKMMRKPRSPAQAIALSCFTPCGFDMEKWCSRLNTTQSWMRQGALRVPIIRFKKKFRRSKLFSGLSYLEKCPLSHGLQKWWVNPLNNCPSANSDYNYQFMKGMKTQHSNTATHLHCHCAVLFGVSECDMLQADIRMEKFWECIGWVNNGQGAGSYSSVNVEILHKDYSGSYDIQTAFLNPILMQVSNITIQMSEH